ncbi:hypothetical protein [Rhodobacter sp. NSM]|uniref:hypothetical protein n=1 Tax=Rhodobacter sp. NSM TaxID=3457501 RepID=UPI003FD3D1D1
MVTRDQLFNDPIRSWMPIAIYKGYLAGMPDIVMGKIPGLVAAARGSRWKTWICETGQEREDVLKQLARPCPVTQGALDFRRGPDRAVSRPATGLSLGPGATANVAVYPPPAEGWPWLVLVWSPHPAPGLERGRYAWDTFETQQALHHHLRHLQGLVPDEPCHVLSPAAP